MEYLPSIESLIPLSDVDSSRSGLEIVLCSVISAGLVGLTGILPLLVIPVEAGKTLKHGAPAARLKLLLSFAAGSILGDVFLHLLPEAWIESKNCGTNLGMGILVGILAFFVIEKVFADDDEATDDVTEDSNSLHQNGHIPTEPQTYTNIDDVRHRHVVTSQREPVTSQRGSQNGANSIHSYDNDKSQQQRPSKPKGKQYQTRGYLNLLANVIDNFTHGLAVGASFLVSRKVGCLTTFAILVHEIPHEVGDFAILLRSGFSRWDAAGAQAMTASGGMIGALTALSAGSLGDFTAWILAFTSGGFIYIAMVTVMPDLLKEHNHRESFKQVVGVCLGICVMALVNGIAG